MRKISFLLVAIGIAIAFSVYPANGGASAAGLESRVNEAFRIVYGRNPSASENSYWVGRVVRKEKTTFDALKGAMYYQKSASQSTPTTSTTSVGGVVASNNKTDMIKNVLPLFISIYGNNPTDAEKAWWRKRISCNEIKSHKDLVSSMKFHQSKKARKGSDSICGGTGATAAATPSGVARKEIAGVSTHPAGNEIRVGIFKTDGRAIHVTANKPYQVREGASKILATIPADEVVQVSWSGGSYHVRGAGVEIDVDNKIRLVPLEGGIMQIKSYNDPSATYPGKNYNRFRGIIEIRKCDSCNELWAINELRTEHYLRGLAETSGTGPEEYIKALGVAARTYALYHKVVTGGRNPARGYDITNTPNDQIYRGYEYEIITSRMSSIFDKTKGIVAIAGDQDSLISTVYFSDSDGRTRSGEEVWKTSKFTHLQSVEDPHHVASQCVGHCTGMSAQGAFGFANKDNWNFQKILNYYFKGIRLVKAY